MTAALGGFGELFYPSNERNDLIINAIIVPNLRTRYTNPLRLEKKQAHRGPTADTWMTTGETSDLSWSDSQTWDPGIEVEDRVASDTERDTRIGSTEWRHQGGNTLLFCVHYC